MPNRRGRTPGCWARPTATPPAPIASGSATYGASQGIHFGLDLSAPCGTELIAMADGVVYAADAMSFGSAPHNLLIDHPDLGYTVLYGHLLQRPNLAPGQTVRAGQVVALSGDPAETCYGRPHLHLEIRDQNNRAAQGQPAAVDRG